MRRLLLVLIAVLALSVQAQDAVKVTHQQFQVVNANGTSAFSGPVKVILEGILLNSPEEWLDPTANSTPGPWQLGGQWEVYIQGEGADHAASAVWMGQNYGNGPGYDNYTSQQWRDEVSRVNRDPNSGYVFTPGDRVRVTGRYLFYKGKMNVNEAHRIEPAYNFTVELVEAAVGLPQPESVRLEQLKSLSNLDIFDSTRKAGGEYYQGRLIRIENVTVVDPNAWGINKTLTIKDETGRTFPVLLGRGAGIGRYGCPRGIIDVVGIVDQTDLTQGYRLLVLNYDGNGRVLTDRGYGRGNLPGDINGDFRVDLIDLAILTGNWLKTVDGL